MDASETFACDEHKNEAVLDAKDEFKKKKEVSSCELINPPVVTDCTDIKLVTSTSVTRVTDLKTTLLEETIVYVKEAILGFLKDGQTAVDSLYIALKVYKEKLDVRGKEWEKILLDDFGIKSGAFRMWEFRNLNLLLTGKRTGIRDGNGGGSKNGKKTPRISQAQIDAQANLAQAKKEFGDAAEQGNEQAQTILAGYEKEAGVTTVEIELPETSAADTLYEILEKTRVTLIHEECDNPPTKTEIETANEVWDTFIKWVTDTDMLDQITMNVGDLNAREATDMALHELAVKIQAAENAASVMEPQAKKKRGRPSKKAAAQLRTEQFDALAEAAA
jgi:hypothetical protein